MNRIISLLPAGTEIIAALGALDQLVAITHECDYPPEVARLPRVTASSIDRDASSADIDEGVRRIAASGLPMFAMDADVVVRLAPTVILTQALCEVCAVSEGDVRDIAQLVSPAPTIVPLGGTTLDGVWADIGNIGKAIGQVDRAGALLESISTRLLLVHQALKRARARRPRVAVIEWLDPLYSAGHWTPNVIQRAGGIDAIAQPGAHSVRITVEQVRDAAPELLLFAPCGFDVERAEREGNALLATDEWSWARDIEAWAIDGNALTSRPGPRLADAVETIAAIIAPTLFPTAPAHYARKLAPPRIVT
jgi:iron complex transport system substrate-binding protein